jgi:integrase
LKTAQITNRQFVFEAKQTKTKAERAVPLPKELFATLRRIGGKEWLWDGWNEDLRKFRLGRNPIPEAFKAETVQCVLENIFREYSDSHPSAPRLSPHDFRRRAITSMVEITGSVDATAELLGVTVQTIRNNYLDPKQAFQTKDAFAKLASALLPLAHTIPTQSENNREQRGTTDQATIPVKSINFSVSQGLLKMRPFTS